MSSFDRVEAVIQDRRYLTEGGFVCRELHLFITLDRLDSSPLDEQQTASGNVRCVGITFVKWQSERRPFDALTGSLYLLVMNLSLPCGCPELSREKPVTASLS